MLPRFWKSNESATAARELYKAIAARAREPVFHRDFAVPDTIDGRFDLLTLHAYLIMEALKTAGPQGAKIGGELATVIFTAFEEALRELGVGDFGISRRMKAMANAFYGRLEAYRATSESGLQAAILRNLYRGNGQHEREAQVLTHYMQRQRLELAGQAKALLQGRLEFGSLPMFE